jgi:hypothetical protein
MKKSLRFLFLTVCLIAACQVQAYPKGKEEPFLERTIEQFSLRDTDLLDVLGKLSFYYRVPIGIELSADESRSPKINLDVRKTKVKDILNMIVLQDDRYRWETAESVVNFIPVKQRDPLLGKVLNVPVQSFRPSRGISKIALRDAITELPEIQEILKVSGVSSYNIGFTSVDRVKVPENINLAMYNTTVRAILNKVVKDTDFKFWVIGRDGNNRNLLYVTL